MLIPIQQSDRKRISQIANYLALSFVFNKEIFSPQDLGVTYTNINYWDKQGILSSKRSKNTAWRNFSYIDYIWLRVIDELRQFGVPTSLIKKAKDECFDLAILDYEKLLPAVRKELKSDSLRLSNEDKEEILNQLDSNKDFEVSYLMYVLCLSIKTRIPLSLFLFKDGSVDFWFESTKFLNYTELAEKKIFQSHLCVSLSSIIKDFIQDTNFTFLLPQLPLLQPNETRLMELIHSGSYDSITIRFQNKKMKTVELLKKQDTKRRVADILMEAAYQDIVVKSHNGMVTHVYNTVKMQFD